MFNGEIGVREADKEGLISNANHGTAESGVKSLTHTSAAAAPVSTTAEKILPLTPRKIQQVMADKAVLLQMNLLSVIFDPDNNRMWLSGGTVPAAYGTYVEYPLFPER
jgi:hypothetical protein